MSEQAAATTLLYHGLVLHIHAPDHAPDAVISWV